MTVDDVYINQICTGTLTVNGELCTHTDHKVINESWLNGVCSGTLTVNGQTYDDLNSNIHTYGICAGIQSTLNTVDIFGDGSGKIVYRFENNMLDSPGLYNATASGVGYSAGVFSNPDFATTSYVPASSTYSTSVRVKET